MSKSMSEWQPIETAPEGKPVDTMIADAHGVRMQQQLIRHGRMWFIPDLTMYVYYSPTHWCAPTPVSPQARE